MNKYIVATIVLILLVSATAFAKQRSIKDSKKDLPKFEAAIGLYDEGDYEEALVEFDKLVKRYPDDYLVNYERALTLYRLSRYDDVVEVAKKLMSNKDVKADVYQLCGNATDMLGEPNEAIKIYAEGLKQFPEAGHLYLEIGNIYKMHDYNDEALRFYNLGIKADPNLASNYYRGAKQYFDTDTAAWGLIYAETEIMLNPNNSQRLADMAKDMIDCYTTKIVQTGNYPDRELNDGDTVRIANISLAPSTNINWISGEDGGTGYVDAAGVIELCYSKALSHIIFDNERFDPQSFESITKLRRYMVDTYFDTAENYFGDGLYLLEYQKKIIDAGHWDAYNYFLFSDVLEYPCDMWITFHRDEYKAFVNWYNDDNHFQLGDGKTVGVLSVLKDVKPKDLIELISFVGNLEKPYGCVELPDDSDE